MSTYTIDRSRLEEAVTLAANRLRQAWLQQSNWNPMSLHTPSLQRHLEDHARLCVSNAVAVMENANASAEHRRIAQELLLDVGVLVPTSAA